MKGKGLRTIVTYMIVGMTGICLSFCLFIESLSASEPPPPDVSYAKTVRFKIDRDRGYYSLESAVKVRVALLSDHSVYQRVGKIREHFATTISRVKAHRGGKKIKKDRIYSGTPIYRDAFFNEEKYWYIDWPETIAPGDTLSYEYKEKYDDLSYVPYMPIWNYNTIDSFVVTFWHPRELKVDFEFYFPRGEIAYTIDRESDKSTTLSIVAPPYVTSLPYFEHDDLIAVVLPRVYRDSTLITPSSVEELSRWYWSDLDYNPSVTPGQGDDLRALLADATPGVSPYKVISDFVRNNFRYVMDVSRSHSIKPFPPAVLLENRYGDCKDRAYLVRALGLVDSLDVQLALINTTPDYDFNGTHPGFFNHVICAVGEGDDVTLFDPTAKYRPFGQLAENLIGQEAVILDPVNPRRVVVAPTSAPPSIHADLTGHLADPTAWRAQITLGGSFRVMAITAIEEPSGTPTDERLETFLAPYFANISFDSLAVASVDSASVHLTARADLTRFILSSSERTYIPQTPFDIVASSILERAEDTLPVHFSRRLALSMNLTMPDSGMSPRSDSLVLGDSTLGGMWAAIMADSADGVVCRYSFSRPQKAYEGGEKDRFLSFCRDYINAKKRMFTIEGLQ